MSHLHLWGVRFNAQQGHKLARKPCRAPSYVGGKYPALPGRAPTGGRFANQIGKLMQG